MNNGVGQINVVAVISILKNGVQDALLSLLALAYAQFCSSTSLASSLASLHAPPHIFHGANRLASVPRVNARHLGFRIAPRTRVATRRRTGTHCVSLHRIFCAQHHRPCIFFYRSRRIFSHARCHPRFAVASAASLNGISRIKRQHQLA